MKPKQLLGLLRAHEGTHSCAQGEAVDTASGFVILLAANSESLRAGVSWPDSWQVPLSGMQGPPDLLPSLPERGGNLTVEECEWLHSVYVQMPQEALLGTLPWHFLARPIS